MEKNKREAEKIDVENNKILAAILRVKASKPVKVDRVSIERQ
jgi:hypothetical protein